MQAENRYIEKQLASKVARLEAHLNALHDFVREFSRESRQVFGDLTHWKNVHVGQHNQSKAGRNIKEWKGEQWSRELPTIVAEEPDMELPPPDHVE